MNKKLKKSAPYLVVIIALSIGLYFFLSPAIDFVARSYNLSHRKSIREAKKSKLPVTYYVSTKGNDQNQGRSSGSAWKTIDQINKVDLNPGDSVLFNAQESFVGNLLLDENDFGTIEKPVYIGSYGFGRATIKAGNGSAITATNSEGIHISTIILEGEGEKTNEGNGIAILNDLRGNIRLENIRIDSVEAFGFGYTGILVEGKKTKSGFKNVNINFCEVHANGDAGLYVKGKYDHTATAYAHENITVSNVKAYNNLGRPESEMNTGSGIVLSDTDKGLIESCIAFNNGALCTSLQGGPVGIWAWDVKNIMIQHNESYGNKTGCPYDGGGFDLDGGSVNSVMQYNYSHDNDGSGYFLAQFYYARKHSGNIIRYNISENDGRKNGYAGIDIWGQIENAYIYNNTIVLGAAAGDTANAILIRPNKEMGLSDQKFPGNISIANNILVVRGNVNLVNSVRDFTSVRLVNNNYYSADTVCNFKWDGKAYFSMEQWRTATGQEKNRNNLSGTSVDPGFLVKGLLDTSANEKMQTMRYSLGPNSPLINKAVDVTKDFGLQHLAADIRGVSLPQGQAYDLGAFEFVQPTGKQ
jgi:hypothetical protein